MFGLSRSKPKILVVDDDPNVVAAFKRQAQLHFKVTTHNDPRRALTEILGGETFAAVLSDYKMPLMNGLDFLEKVKSTLPLTPLFLFTGLLDLPDVRGRISALGLRGSFFKPLSSTDIITAIHAQI